MRRRTYHRIDIFSHIGVRGLSFALLRHMPCQRQRALCIPYPLVGYWALGHEKRSSVHAGSWGANITPITGFRHTYYRLLSHLLPFCVYHLSRFFLRGCAHSSVRCQVLLRREYPPPVSLSFDSDKPLCFHVLPILLCPLPQKPDVCVGRLWHTRCD